MLRLMKSLIARSAKFNTCRPLNIIIANQHHQHHSELIYVQVQVKGVIDDDEE